MSAKIEVFIKEPGKNARHVHISPTLKNLQNTVGEYIETFTIASNMTIICNEEGKLLGLPYNCKICGERFCGTLIFIGVNEEGEFCDVPVDTKNDEAGISAAIYGGINVKISKLKKVLSKSNNLIISRDQAGTQWIGDGVAMYSMDKFPEMTPAQILTVLGVPEDQKKRAMWYVEEDGPEVPELQQIAMIDRDPHAIEYNGTRSVILEGANGSVFWVKEMYLEPHDTVQTQHYLCSDRNGQLYLASYEGMFISAVIRQQNMTGQFIEWLHMVSQTATALHTEQVIKGMKEEENE